VSPCGGRVHISATPVGFDPCRLGKAVAMRVWLVLLVAVILMQDASAQDMKGGIQRVRVPATASAEVTPDMAEIVVGVISERKTAADAAAENARAAQAVIDQIKALGIAPRDIRTLGITLSPNYSEEREPSGRTKRTFTGYTARNSVEVRVREIDKVGAVARALIDRGANLFGGVQFAVSDAEQRVEALRVTAIKDAAVKAKTYAEALGLKLGRVLEIEPEPEASERGMMRRAKVAEGATGIPVEPGVQTLSARVTVTWELVQ
jgi:uncharacterized protein YggE